MPKKIQTKYDSDTDSDSETESKKMIMKLIKKHSKMHGAGIFDDIGSYVTNKKGLASDVLQYGLPSAMGAMGALGGPAGAIAGKEGGVLLSKKIAEDNDMSRRSQDPFDSGFLQQRDVKQKPEQNYVNPYDPLTKEERAQMNDLYKNYNFNNRYDYTDLKRGIIKGNTKRTEAEQQAYDNLGGYGGMGGMGIHMDVLRDIGSGRMAKSGMGFFDDLKGDLRTGKYDEDGPIKHHGYIAKPAVPKFEKEMNVGEGLKSRKKSKDHVSRRAFDEYIKNETERLSRKDLAESRAIRAGKKAKPAGGYGYGLKGSPEMAEKMAKLRAMKKK